MIADASPDGRERVSAIKIGELIMILDYPNPE